MCYKAEQLSTANCQLFNANVVFTSMNYSLLFVCQVHFRYPLPFLLMISFLFPQWLWSPSSTSHLTSVPRVHHQATQAELQGSLLPLGSHIGPSSGDSYKLQTVAELFTRDDQLGQT